MPFSLAIIGIVVGYSWVLVPLLGNNRILGLIPVVAVLALCLGSAMRTGEWGLRRTEFLPALKWVSLLTIVVVTPIYLAGDPVDLFPLTTLAYRQLLFLFFWALGQQFALQTVLLREARASFAERKGILLAAALFALLHLPNPFLTAMTFIGGLAWCWIYSRHPNLVPLALSHAFATIVIVASLDRSITGGLRVGYSYLLLAH